MTVDLRALIRMLERRIEELERLIVESGLRRGRLATRPPRFLDVKLTEAIASGASGTCVVLDYNADSDAEVETDTEIEVHNPWNTDFAADARAVVIERPWQAPPRRWHLLVPECG